MSNTRVFRRKIYDRMLQWKKERDGKTALLPVFMTPFL